jgi:hypothetical protein
MVSRRLEAGHEKWPLRVLMIVLADHVRLVRLRVDPAPSLNSLLTWTSIGDHRVDGDQGLGQVSRS